VKRFEGKKLLDIESHTSADSRSGRIGDIDIVDEKGRAFEAVEVKHGIPITGTERFNYGII
jgi:DNA (cytosine-5)-methyltransferase 1